MQSIIGKHWHHLPVDEVLELLDSDREKGLDHLEVNARLEHFGKNVLPGYEPPSALRRFLSQFHQPLVYILLGAGTVAAFVKGPTDASVIFGVVLVNALVGYLQESKASKALQALESTMSTPATVIRGGQKDVLPGEELVPGDIVQLQSGDKVPADLRLVKSRDLQIDESTLTGESLPVQKEETVLPRETPLADRHNMLYATTLVTYAQGLGVVVATGADTEVGRISELIETADQLSTPLTRNIGKFSHVLLWMILALAGATFLLGYYRGEGVPEMLMASIALAVGAIPEGLPAAVTITLSIGVGRMARRRAIIRKLPAVETLGSTNVICSDKTGTLTENQMTVRKLFAGGCEYDVTGNGYQPDGEIEPEGDAPSYQDNQALMQCLRVGMLCNDTEMRKSEQQWQVQGDPTEGAMLVAGIKAELSRQELKKQWPRVDSIPFESEHQYMATLHDSADDGLRSVMLKGAVEKILARCDNMLTPDGQRVSLETQAIETAAHEMAGQGLRVLAFATAEVQDDISRIDHEDLGAGLTFLGLQGMIDPPRSEAIVAVEACHRAGIQVKMITGDHAVTATAIAKQLGLGKKDAESDRLGAFTGQDIANLSDDELINAVKDISVFARVNPEQKLRLVRAMQARGDVIAMTGDGVNDAPALRQADIGVAMGITGTEVAKEAADMVLTDDNFASIEAAVEEGRGVFDNLQKFIVWTLPTNLGEGLVILAAVLFATAMPIEPVQILWINMTTAVLLGLMLAFEPKEEGIMNRPPRDTKAPLLDNTVIVRIVLVGLFLLVCAFGLFEWIVTHRMDSSDGVSEGQKALVIAQARTVAVNVFVFVEMFYLFNCRSLTRSMFTLGLFTNPCIWYGVIIMTLLQLAFTYVPVMNTIFNTAPISVGDWGLILGAATVGYILIGLEKYARQRLGGG